ncbi:hypothetical protein ABT270_05705 [Streptomyces sp900105245]|uniref:hypothetical protein n=1 Tax=Streptomyces sp. 900105245 TaxID=3154379 RepID=UPI003323B209
MTVLVLRRTALTALPLFFDVKGDSAQQQAARREDDDGSFWCKWLPGPFQQKMEP